MLYVYAGSHRPDNPHAPRSITTTVSPRVLSLKELEDSTRAETPFPLVESKLHTLTCQQAHESLEATNTQVMRDYLHCARCYLSERRDHVVLTRGNLDAAVLVMGEGPGKRENAEGKPFVGPSGRLQDQLFREVGIDPDQDVAWANLIGCRSTPTRWEEADRPPTLVEKLACSERLTLILKAIRPRVVLCLGKHATSLFWDEPPRHNMWYTFQQPDGEKLVVGVARHPSYLLRAMMQNYREYYAVKMFLRRLKLGIRKLTKLPKWTRRPQYVETFEAVGQPLSGS